MRSGIRRFVSSKRLGGKFCVTKIKGEVICFVTDDGTKSKVNVGNAKPLEILYLLRDWMANSVLQKSEVNVRNRKRN